MTSNLLINAKDIEQWAERLDARSQLPRLVRRLIQATAPDIERLQFNADEGVQLGGWDGIVTAHDGNAFVPPGVSAWEMGVNKDRKGKADDDYITRTNNTLGLDPTKTTFVFVTPRQWSNKEDWANNRRAEGKWANVRVYDSSDIETWLEGAPAVHLWLSMLVGKHPQGAWSLDDYWSDWTAKTAPTFSPALVIGGRQSSRERIEAWLRGSAAPLTLAGESFDEALAFLSAVIAAQDEVGREQWFSRAIVVEDAASWRTLALSNARSILIPRFREEVEGVSRAVKSGNHVFLAGEHNGARSDNALPRIVRDAAETALSEMGMPRERAKDLATLGRRSFPALRRKLASELTLKKPDWAQPQVARVLLAPLLAGSWQGLNEADREILARLAGTSYEQLQENLVFWSKAAEPPIRLVGGIWMIAAPEDAWRLLAPFLSDDDIARFKTVAVEVLSTSSNPPSSMIEKWKKVAEDETPRISPTLCQGIASTLALMAALSSQVSFVSESSGEETAHSVMWSLFDKAKSDAAMWASFAPVLPLLAEAAPTPFLDAVDAGLTGETPFLRQMFSNEDYNYGFGPTSPHNFLLWALETLTWNANFFGRAVLCLARLARIDPGGKNGNRPASSLRETFVVWYPNTTVSLVSRLGVLDAMRKHEPVVAWDLMLQILPTIHGDACQPTHGPKWHDWKPDEERRITEDEMVQAVEATVDRLLADVGIDAKRWCELIARVEALWPQLREKLLDKMDELAPNLSASEARMAMSDAVRSVIVRHREFPDTDWAMPEEYLARLEVVGRKLEPDDLVLRHRWRFQQYVELQERSEMDWKQREEAVAQLRFAALEEISTVQGWDDVLRLASQVEDPQSVGFTLGAMSQPPINVDVFLAENLASSEPWRAAIALGWVRHKAWRDDQSWLQARLDAAQNNWQPEQWGEFFLPFLFSLSLLNRLDELEESAQRYYWGRAHNMGFLDEKGTERVIERLLWAGRAVTATRVIRLGLHTAPGLVSPERIMEVLEVAISRGSIEELSASRHESAKLLDHLAQTDAPHERLARLEWLYFGLHEHARRPKILHEELGRDPAFFVETLSQIFRARPGETETDEREESDVAEEPEPEDSQEVQLKAAFAKRAWSLLWHWHQIPGLREDGTLDEEHLKSWVARARELATKQGLSVVTLIHIGQALAHSPRDEDGSWPHRAVRDTIEDIANPRLESGFQCQVFNNRGVTSRGLTDGGAQERVLVERYEKDAAQIADGWPRTASVLRGLAQDYRRHAESEDRSAELVQDMWN